MLKIRRTALLVLIGCLYLAAAGYAHDLPERISDDVFWQMVSNFSEGGGYFQSDNFVSNEIFFQRVIPQLKKNLTGGAYLGVGPDQNFTYLVAIQPSIAFIIDIRRQALLQQLMYKAIIEVSDDRADFLSRLFSRPRPTEIDDLSSARELFDAYDAAEPYPLLFEKNLRAILDRLIAHHGFTLSDDDQHGIEYVYRAFFRAGPDLTYSSTPYLPTYAQLMQATDGRGENQSYLASETNFRILQKLELNNLVIPLVGDFAGSKAVRSVAEYLRQHDAIVTAFYTSNVEQYLFQQGNWKNFYLNVAELPIDPQSTFIRWIPKGSRYAMAYKRNRTVLSSMSDLMRAFSEGEIRSYRDVINMSD